MAIDRRDITPGRCAVGGVATDSARNGLGCTGHSDEFAELRRARRRNAIDNAGNPLRTSGAGFGIDHHVGAARRGAPAVAGAIAQSDTPTDGSPKTGIGEIPSLNLVAR